jgi:hypothetical protein
MAMPTTRLYLLCYAWQRYRQLNDNLIDAFIHLIAQYEKQAKLVAVDTQQQALVDASTNLRAASQVLNLFVDKSIPDNMLFSMVKQTAFSLLEPEQFSLVSNYMRNIEFDKVAYEWACYGTLQHKFRLNLRHLFCNLDFASMIEDAPLLNAVSFLQSLILQGKVPRQVKADHFPVTVIPKSVQRYMYSTGSKCKDKCLEVDRYEFLVYRLLRNALEAGNVYVKDSNDFRSFEDDLIKAERWKDKDAVLYGIGSPILLTAVQETLAAYREESEAKFRRVNKRIGSGENKHIKITGTGDKRHWSLIYPSEEESINSPFYGQLPVVAQT